VGAAAFILVAVAASPLGGAIARGVSDFSAWLSGEPGQPASEAEQRAFEQANARSWAGFPGGPQLRRLIRGRAGTTTYDLFGFRTGDSLCLRLVVHVGNENPATSCAPLRELRSTSAPALVVVTDESFGESNIPADALPGEYAQSRAAATFGIVADGVKAIELDADDGAHQAIVGSNAFVYVADRPPVGNRVRRAFAVTDEGRRIPVPLAQAPFGYDVPTEGSGKPYGPSRVERPVTGGAIEWIERREPRGDLPPADAPYLKGFTEFQFARVIKPDPAGATKVVVGLGRLEFPGRTHPEPRGYCMFLVTPKGSGGGCNPPEQLFAHTPFSFGLTGYGGGDQFVTLHGLASDAVARLELFLGTREREAVSLRDNVYLAQVARTKFPVRLVAYDSAGRVIGIQTVLDAFGGAGPRPVRGQERIAQVVEAASGAKVVLRVSPSTDGGRCWRIDYSGGGGGGACPPRGSEMPTLDASLHHVGGDTFLEAQLAPRAAALELRFDDGTVETRKPIESFVLYAVPGGRRLDLVIARDSTGKALTERRFGPRD
jgi:hypothetical protein